MADLVIDEASRAALDARLASPEGRVALDDLARTIAESFARSLPTDVDLALDTPDGQADFREAWPAIVDAFLFRRGPKPKARRSRAGRKKLVTGEVGAAPEAGASG